MFIDMICFVDPAVAETDKAKVAFDKNYPKLQGIKKKYDPENIFNKWFPIMPA
jgi:FAD/FMN-containing dehydrogenase